MSSFFGQGSDLEEPSHRGSRGSRPSNDALDRAIGGFGPSNDAIDCTTGGFGPHTLAGAAGATARAFDHGRFFPLGDRFDATFSKMRDSRPGFGQPEHVGSFPTDKSPYGVRDMAGGMRCWARPHVVSSKCIKGDPAQSHIYSIESQETRAGPRRTTSR